jgi:hypothetical protein
MRGRTVLLNEKAIAVSTGSRNLHPALNFGARFAQSVSPWWAAQMD